MKIFSFLILLALIVFVGCKDDEESLIEVEACFDYMPESDIETGEKVRFLNCSENATAFRWSFGDGTLYIFYFSESSSATGWDNHIVSAEKSGNSWTLNQEYNIDEVAQISLDIGMTFSIYSDASLSHGFIDISDDDPFVAEKGSQWNYQMIQGYTGWTENDDVHIDLVNSSEYCLTWLNTRNTPMFVEYNFNTGQINEYPVENTPAGNLFPATKDIVTGDFYGFYCQSWSSERYMKIVKSDGTDEEVLFDGIGVPMGKRVLNARNGRVALVTGDEDAANIYVTVSGLVY
jgi:hypothetical protein